MKRSMTLRYTLHQMTHWAAAAGVISFASAFLLEKGFPASQVGVLLAAGNLLSCAVQPVLADWADRIGGNALKRLVLLLTLSCMGCLTVLELMPMPRPLYALCYLTAVFTFDAMNPLLNALSVSYCGRGYRINYGLARGLGSFAFAGAALIIGEAMAQFGADRMVWITLGLLLAQVVTVGGYPAVTGGGKGETSGECCSVPVFFRRYPMYCLSLLGVLLLAMFHAMTETYLIEIVRPLGGDSGTVGVALFIATVVEMLVLVNFDRVRARLRDPLLMKLAGISFLVKAVLFLLAPGIPAIYAVQLLQATSYTFLSPTSMYYAGSRVLEADMVKGQAFITAAYTLGCAAGTFLGGQLLAFSGITALLAAGIAMAAGGTGVLFLTVEKRDRVLES